MALPGREGSQHTQHKNSSASQDLVPLGDRRGWGATLLSPCRGSTVLVFPPLLPSPWVSPDAFLRPSLMPKKQKGVTRRGQGCGLNHKQCTHLSPSFHLTPPDHLRASQRAAPTIMVNSCGPETLLPSCLTKDGFARLCPSHQQGARGTKWSSTSSRTPPPEGAYLLQVVPLEPWSPAQ